MLELLQEQCIPLCLRCVYHITNMQHGIYHQKTRFKAACRLLFQVEVPIYRSKFTITHINGYYPNNLVD